jgi:hypothetical protein
MVVTVTLRPGKRTTVQLPFRNGDGNYQLLKDIRGEGTRPAYNPQTKLFEVARDYGDQLIHGLVDEFRSVRVVIHGNSRTTCVSECWDADPSNAWNCVCGCAGSNHGSGHPLGKEVKAGLSVENQHTRAEYLVTRQGWTFVK